MIYPDKFHAKKMELSLTLVKNMDVSRKGSNLINRYGIRGRSPYPIDSSLYEKHVTG